MELLYILLMLLSAVFFFGGLVHFLRRRNNRLSSRLLVFSACILCAVLLVQVVLRLAGSEKLFPSSLLIHVMQAFSMDLDYDILDVPLKLFAAPLANSLLSVYIFLLLTAAPIAGGAMIYEVLAGVSPSLRMFFRRRSDLFVFSQLNRKSLILAADIAARGIGGRKATVVFTDSASNLDICAELLPETRRFGAIVLQDDFLHADTFRKARSCTFFLIRESGDGLDDAGNLADLRSLLDPDTLREKRVSWPKEAGCRVFLFTNSSETAENVRITKKLFDSVLPENTERRVTVHVVRDQGQTCLTLLKNHPLFLPLGPHEQKQPLRVVLFGNTSFSREMFQNIFWCGQLLDHPLYISAVYGRSASYAEKEPEWESFLNRTSPEILESCTWDPRPELLRVWRGREDPDAFGAPYCGLSVIEENPFRTGISDLLSRERRYGYGCGESYRLSDCDYYFVMGEDDRENASLAGSLRRELIRQQLVTGKTRAPERRQVIAFCSADETLGSQLSVLFEGDPDQGISPAASFGTTPPEVLSFGSLSERFSWESVSMDGAYLSVRTGSAAHGSADINEKSGDIYERWATIGREVHKRYKMYCAGSAQGRPPLDKEGSLREKLAYLQALYSGTDASDRLCEDLLYLEHRRWNAFIRVQGFSRPFENMERVLDTVRGSADAQRDHCRVFAYKDIPNRMHPCLVESAPARVPDLWRERTPEEMRKDLDMLDHISWIRNVLDGKQTDLKKYDHPGGSNLPSLTQDEALAFLAGSGSASLLSELRAGKDSSDPYSLYETAYAAGKLLAKKNETASPAFRLGEGHALEKRLLDKGSLRLRGDGRYTVFTREAPEAGQTAEAGDYVKLDSEGFPYPNRRDFFEANHTPDGPDTFLQHTPPLSFWKNGLPHPGWLDRLLEDGSLIIREDNGDAFFTARSDSWETGLTAAKDAVIVKNSGTGFHFVDGQEFDKTYKIVYAP